jgi:hypothetical protein
MTDILPIEIKLNKHALHRLLERKNRNTVYNLNNIMKSDNVKWYNRNDLRYGSGLYNHSCYATRKSKEMEYITDGNIEVIYNKETGAAITVLEVKDKFKPITRYIKPVK